MLEIHLNVCFISINWRIIFKKKSIRTIWRYVVDTTYINNSGLKSNKKQDVFLCLRY